MSNNFDLLGPLSIMPGIWEGEKGVDIAPGPDRKKMTTRYREQIKFDYMGQVDNHEQKLQALRYSMTAWRIGESDPFHEELGYWMWDAKEQQVLRCFMVPRGVTVIAGGKANPKAKELKLSARLGTKTYGICSNKFLDKKFRTVKYDLKLKILAADSFSYFEDTQLKIAGQAKVFHHTDANTLVKVTN